MHTCHPQRILQNRINVFSRCAFELGLFQKQAAVLLPASPKLCDHFGARAESDPLHLGAWVAAKRGSNPAASRMIRMAVETVVLIMIVTMIIGPGTSIVA